MELRLGDDSGQGKEVATQEQNVGPWQVSYLGPDGTGDKSTKLLGKWDIRTVSIRGGRGE